MRNELAIQSYQHSHSVVGDQLPSDEGDEEHQAHRIQSVEQLLLSVQIDVKSSTV